MRAVEREQVANTRTRVLLAERWARWPFGLRWPMRSYLAAGMPRRRRAHTRGACTVFSHSRGRDRPARVQFRQHDGRISKRRASSGLHRCSRRADALAECAAASVAAVEALGRNMRDAPMVEDASRRCAADPPSRDCCNGRRRIFWSAGLTRAHASGASDAGLSASPLAFCLSAGVQKQAPTTPCLSGGIPVVCVGNLTVWAGSAKTPVRAAIRGCFDGEGSPRGVLSRGYGGGCQGGGYGSAGHAYVLRFRDEPLMLAASGRELDRGADRWLRRAMPGRWRAGDP